MLCIFPPHHAQHQAPAEIFNGQRDEHQETPARLERIMSSLKDNSFEIEPFTAALPDTLLAKVHTPAYLKFLQRQATVLEVDSYLYPSVFKYRTGTMSQNPLAQLGYYSFDLYTPLGELTYQAALDSATCAYQVAKIIQTTTVKTAYALGRPPGHHAESDQMGGYCYLNNAAIAAEYLSEFGKVATLDVDFHHGNGTQHIFYQRKDVMTTSIHADPNWKFPFFSGYNQEIGENEGEGYNYNIPLQKGITNEKYQHHLEITLQKITDFNPLYLVVSFGADTHEADPIGGFKLTTEYFTTMARTIRQLNLPTAIIQEGGYNTNILGDNVVRFLQGFED